jgi:glycosyltransferase 2 family protein
VSRALRRSARVVGPALVLGVLVWRLGTSPFLDGLRTINGAALAAAVGLVALTTVCSAWRWKLVAGGLGVDLSLPTAVGAYYRSLFLNVVLPGGIVGDVHRGVSHGREVSNVGRGLRSVAWERLAGQVVQLVLTVGVLLALPSPVRPFMPLLVIAVAVVALGVLLVVRTRADGARSAWARGLSASGTDIRDGLLARRSCLGITLASALAVVGHAAVFLLAARTAGTTAPLLRMLPIASIVLWAGVFPSVGGLGPREGLTAWAFAAAGLGADRGVAAAVVYGVMILVACLPGAVFLVVGWLRDTRRTRRPKLPLRERAARA